MEKKQFLRKRMAQGNKKVAKAKANKKRNFALNLRIKNRLTILKEAIEEAESSIANGETTVSEKTLKQLTREYNQLVKGLKEIINEFPKIKTEKEDSVKL